MSEVVGSIATATGAPAEPYASRSASDGEVAVVDRPSAQGTALVVQAGRPPDDLRHNAGWLALRHVAQDGTRVIGAVALFLIRGARGLCRLGGALFMTLVNAVKVVGDWLFGLAKIAIVGLAGFIIVKALLQPALVVDPIAVTPELADRGSDGEQLAGRIIENLAGYDFLVRQVWSEKESRALNKPAQLPELQVPGAQVSLRQIVDAIRAAFGASDRRVIGQLVLVSKGDEASCGSDRRQRTIVLRLQGAYDEFVYERAEAVCIDDDGARKRTIAILMEDASRAILRATNPCGAAAYYYALWRNPADRDDLRFDIAHRMIEVCVVRPNGGDRSAAHQLKGLMLKLQANATATTTEDDRSSVRLLLGQALESFNDAERSFRESLWNRALSFVGLSQFLAMLEVHRGDALLDLGKQAGAVGMTADARLAYKQASDADGGHVYAWLGLARALQAEMASTPDEQFERKADLLVASLCAVTAGLGRRPDAAVLYHQKALILADYVRLRWSARQGAGVGGEAAALPVAAVGREYCKEFRAPSVSMTRAQARNEASYVLTMARDVEPENAEFALTWARLLAALAVERGGSAVEPEQSDAFKRAIDAIRKAREMAEKSREDPFYTWDGEAMLQLVVGRLDGARGTWEQAADYFRQRGNAASRSVWQNDARASSSYFLARVDVLGERLPAAIEKLEEAKRYNSDFDEAKSLLQCVSSFRQQPAPAATLVAGAAAAGRLPGDADHLRLQCRIGLPDG